eukprot:CAMPEP_0113669926 /NCGR_PEP_ID=MMETSP0038_2-20120614/4851_1 /TAXON_ID=2898 /ORGANISM="Cryptomonas paramecium" /LENGTH=302 /DNA_ID=CAMNT_0000585883 /DNA_START=132 /DNA_END=1036 /DNA_ORIENTATION=- /assembly_acc=CAM_ASM_000170
MQTDQLSKVEMFLDIPVDVTGLVVGKKGVTIKKIKQTSKANVMLLPELPAENVNRLAINGSKRDAENAQEQIVKLLASWCGFGSEGGVIDRHVNLLPTITRDLVLSQRSTAVNHRAKAGAQGLQSSQGSIQQAGQKNPQHSDRPHTAPSIPSRMESSVTQDSRNLSIPSSHPLHPSINPVPTTNGQQAKPETAVPSAGGARESSDIREELEVPRACINFIVGKNFENIAHLERSSGAQIFPVEPARGDNPNTLRIAIVGAEQGVHIARMRMQQGVHEWTVRVQQCLQAFQAQVPAAAPLDPA